MRRWPLSTGRWTAPRPASASAALVAGFPAGGMLVWNAICSRGDAVACVPCPGSVRVGPPGTCPAGPAPLIHIDGDAEPTMPMAGRPIAGTRQGDARRALITGRGRGVSGGGAFTLAGLRCESPCEAPRLDLRANA